MASSGGVTLYGSRWAHNAPAWWNHSLLNLRASNLVPHGERGRRQIEGQFHGPHIVNAILALAAPDTHEAASTVVELRALRFYGHNSIPESSEPLLPGLLLGEALDNTVESLADLVESDNAGEPLPVEDALPVLRRIECARHYDARASRRLGETLPSEIVVHEQPPLVEVQWAVPVYKADLSSDYDHVDHVDRYTLATAWVANVAPPYHPGFRRSTYIRGWMLELAGALLSDTRFQLRRFGVSTSRSQERNDVESASAEGDSAPSAPLGQPQSHDAKTDTADPSCQGQIIGQTVSTLGGLGQSKSVAHGCERRSRVREVPTRHRQGRRIA